MSIDTAKKRSSVFQLPGLQMNAYPNPVGVQAGDRQHMADIYEGILAQLPAFLPNQTCWSASADNSGSWKQSGQNSSTWLNPQANSSRWKSPLQNSSTWKKDKKIIPQWEEGKDVTPC